MYSFYKAELMIYGFLVLADFKNLGHQLTIISDTTEVELLTLAFTV